MSKRENKKKEDRKKIREERLKLFNQEEDHYEELHIGDKWYIKMLLRMKYKEMWTVAEYSEQAYNNYKNGYKTETYLQKEHIKNIINN